MFMTIFTVRKKFGFLYEQDIFSAYFEDFEEAKRFAESEVENGEEKVFSYSKKTYPDGSFCYSWLSDNCWITLDDNAYVTDYRSNGFSFANESGLKTCEFETMEELRAYLKRSQEIAKN